MKSPWRAAIVLLALLIPSTVPAVDWLDVDGYIKSFAAGIHPAPFTNPEAAPEQNFIWANNNRARANLSIYAAKWLEFDASYDLSLRIQEAQRLLVATNQSVGEIAAATGFYDQSHFTKRFRKLTEMNPPASRKRFRS